MKERTISKLHLNGQTGTYMLLYAKPAISFQVLSSSLPKYLEYHRHLFPNISASSTTFPRQSSTAIPLVRRLATVGYHALVAACVRANRYSRSRVARHSVALRCSVCHPFRRRSAFRVACRILFMLDSRALAFAIVSAYFSTTSGGKREITN